MAFVENEGAKNLTKTVSGIKEGWEELSQARLARRVQERANARAEKREPTGFTKINVYYGMPAVWSTQTYDDVWCNRTNSFKRTTVEEYASFNWGTGARVVSVKEPKESGGSRELHIFPKREGEQSINTEFTLRQTEHFEDEYWQHVIITPHHMRKHVPTLITGENVPGEFATIFAAQMETDTERQRGYEQRKARWR